MTASDKRYEYEWEWVKQSDFMFQKKQKANLVPEWFYSIFYAILLLSEAAVCRCFSK